MRPAHYSGDLSRDFWNRVNALPEPQRAEAYSLGVVLQNVESDVLRIIANIETAIRMESRRMVDGGGREKTRASVPKRQPRRRRK